MIEFCFCTTIVCRSPSDTGQSLNAVRANFVTFNYMVVFGAAFAWFLKADVKAGESNYLNLTSSNLSELAS